MEQKQRNLCGPERRGARGGAKSRQGEETLSKKRKQNAPAEKKRDQPSPWARSKQTDCLKKGMVTKKDERAIATEKETCRGKKKA